MQPTFSHTSDGFTGIKRFKRSIDASRDVAKRRTSMMTPMAQRCQILDKDQPNEGAVLSSGAFSGRTGYCDEIRR